MKNIHATLLALSVFFFAVLTSNGTPVRSRILTDSLSVSVQTTSVNCYLGADGSATASVTGGQPPYIYRWTPDGQTDSVVTGLTAGSYRLTVLDANNDTATVDFSIIQPPPLLVSASNSNASTIYSSDAWATAYASGGTPPYTYLWSPSGGTDSTADSLSVGTYTVVVTDANGCIDTVPITILSKPVQVLITENNSPRVCDSTQFTIAVHVFGSYIGDTLNFGIDTASGLTFTPPDVQNGIYNVYYIGQCNDSCTRSFYINFKCDWIPTDSSLNNIVQNVILYDGSLNQISTDSIAWTFLSGTVSPVNANPTQIQYPIGYYSLVRQISSTNTLSANTGETIKRLIAYKNNGTIPFDGSLFFSDSLPCNNIQIDSIDVYRHDTTSINHIARVSLLSNNFTYNFNSSPVAVQDSLIIQETITVTNCLSRCTDNSHFTANWGCAGNMCRSDNFSAALVRSTNAPLLSLYRISPSPSGNAPNQQFWDTTCPGTTVYWKYALINMGTDIAYNVHIPIFNQGHSFYMCDSSSVSLLPCTNCVLPPDSIVLYTYTPILLNSPHLVCAESMTSPITDIEYRISSLVPNDTVFISFATTFCCPDSNNGSSPDTNRINLFNEPFKTLNSWVIDPQDTDECGTFTHFVSDTLHSGSGLYNAFKNISTNFSFASANNLYLMQDFSPMYSDIGGITSPYPMCDTLNPVPFKISNLNFNGNALGSAQEPYRNDVNIFSPSYSSAATMTVNTNVRLLFKMDPTLRLYPLVDTVINIKRGATLWRPAFINLSVPDTCSTLGDTARYYEVIFNGGDLAAALSLTNLDLLDFLQFMNGSEINFSYVSCCCSYKTNANYSVQFYIQGSCPDCWIPMTEQSGLIHVHCPGCVLPGVEVNNATMQRSNFGFNDANNDGVADNHPPQPINFNTYSQKNNLRLDRSMQGDTLVGKIDAVFHEGSAITYDSLKNITCDHCDSTISGSYGFAHLYFDQTIPYSDSSHFNLKLLSCNFTVKRSTATLCGDTILQFSLSTADIDSVNAHHTIDSTGQFYFDFTPASIQAATGCGTYTFTPDEKYDIQTTYLVCKNYLLSQNDELPVDNKFKSEVFSGLYFSSIAQPQMPFSNHSQAGDYFNSADTDSCFKLCHQYVFTCGTFSCLHYFYSIHTENSSYIGTHTFGMDGYACGKYMVCDATTDIGGSAFNVFPYEFRPAPRVTAFQVTVPAGYKIRPLLNPSVHLGAYAELSTQFDTYLPTCYPSRTEVIRQNVFTLPSYIGTFTYSPILEDADSVNMGSEFGCARDTMIDTSRVVMIGDEHAITQLFFELEPDSCPATPDTIYLDSTYITEVFNNYNCDLGGTASVGMYCAVTNCMFLKAHPQLTFQDINPGVSDTSAIFVKTVRFYNSSAGGNNDYAENVFLYFPTSTEYYVDSIVCISAACSPFNDTLPDIHGIWELGVMHLDQNYDYNIYFHVLYCDSKRDTQLAIPTYWGWNCNDYPDTIPDPRVCHLVADTMHYQQASVLVTHNLQINDGDNEYGYCEDEKFEITIKSIKSGGIDSIYASITLPPNVSIDSTLTMLQYCNAGGCDSLSTPHDTIVGSTYTFLLLPPSGYLNNGDSLVFDFYLYATCGYDGTMPIISVSQHNYCGETSVTDTLTNVFSWSYSGNDYCDPSCSPYACTGDSIYTGTTYSSSIGNDLTGLSIVIGGTFIVDGSLNIISCDVKMMPGSVIIVNSGYTLSLVHTHLSACDSMWQGIVVNTKSVLNVYKFSTIEDAQYGANLKYGSSLRGSNSEFKRDYIGIYAVEKWANIVLNSCRFTCPTPLDTAYDGQDPLPLTHTFAGIFVNDFYSLNVSGTDYGYNYFDSLNYGIYSLYSNVSVVRTQFQDIQFYDNYELYYRKAPGSAAIFSFSKGANTLKVFGHGIGDGAITDFINCNRGVYSFRVNTSIVEAKMQQMQYGITTLFGTNLNLSVYYNKIEASYAGIEMLHDDGATSLSVENNRITMVGDSIPHLARGISIQGSNTANNSPLIYGNTIDMQSVNSVIGIDMMYSKGYQVKYNDVHINDSAATANGMNLQKSDSALLSCNTVYGDSGNDFSIDTNHIAVNTMDCMNYFYKCNTVNNTYEGFTFSGSNWSTNNNDTLGNFESNDIKNHYYGLHVTASGLMGAQTHKGNLWYLQSYGSGDGAIDEDSLSVLNDQYLVNIIDTSWSGQNTDLPYPVSPSSGWFSADAFTDSICGDSSNTFCSDTVIIIEGGTGGLSGLTSGDGQVARGAVHSAMYDEQTVWKVRRALMEKLLSNTDLIDEDPTISDFYYAYTDDNIGNLGRILLQKNTLNAIDVGTATAVQANNEARDQIAQAIAVNDSTMSVDTTLSTTAIAVLDSTNDSLATNVATLTVSDSTYYAVAQTSRTQVATNIAQANSLISSEKVYESNEKTVNDIYLKTLASDNYEDLSRYARTLYDIAHQCPLAGGPAVYHARTLYYLLDDQIIYDDKSVCSDAGIALRHAKKPNKPIESCYLYPNPTTGKVTVEYHLENENENGKLMLFNTVGNCIRTYQLNGKQTKFDFDISSLPNSILEYKIFDNNGILAHGKLVIIK